MKSKNKCLILLKSNCFQYFAIFLKFSWKTVKSINMKLTILRISCLAVISWIMASAQLIVSSSKGIAILLCWSTPTSTTKLISPFVSVSSKTHKWDPPECFPPSLNLKWDLHSWIAPCQVSQKSSKENNRTLHLMMRLKGILWLGWRKN